jgi:hypothetical protein
MKSGTLETIMSRFLNSISMWLLSRYLRMLRCSGDTKHRVNAPCANYVISSANPSSEKLDKLSISN